MTIMPVRQFKETDAIIVSKIISRCLFEVSAPFYPKKILKNVSNFYSPEEAVSAAKTKKFLIYEQDNQILGSARLEIETGHIGGVFVDPEHNGQGIGSQLMSELEEFARENGLKKTSLGSSLNAVSFYERLGYQKGKLIEDKEMGNLVYMEKTLS